MKVSIAIKVLSKVATNEETQGGLENEIKY